MRSLICFVFGVLGFAALASLYAVAGLPVSAMSDGEFTAFAVGATMLTWGVGIRILPSCCSCAERFAAACVLKLAGRKA